MAIETIFSFLVPAKAGTKLAEIGPIGAVQVPLAGKLFDLQEEIYSNAPEACRITIAFQNVGADGQQHNPVRQEIIDYSLAPTLATAQPLAIRLASVTTKRSKLGLLFLTTGTENGKTRTVISRFPADSGILADDTKGALNLAFIEQVFMKSSRSFKAVMYESSTPRHRFWSGNAIDRQVSADDTQIRAYWVQDFLMSQYKTTSAEGTRRLAVALKDAIKKCEDVDIQEEIIAAARLAKNLGGQTLSGNDLFDRFGLSDQARNLILDCLPDKKVLTETFVFDLTEFNGQLPYQTLRLHNGASMTAPSENFDKIFKKEKIETENGIQTKISTVGNIVDQHFGKQY